MIRDALCLGIKVFPIMSIFKQLLNQKQNLRIMDLKDFIENFAAQFDDTDASEIKAETVFKELDEWSSLIALSVIAMADEEYEVTLKGDDIRNASTIEDLFNTVKSKM